MTAKNHFKRNEIYENFGTKKPEVILNTFTDIIYNIIAHKLKNSPKLIIYLIQAVGRRHIILRFKKIFFFDLMQ